MLISGVESAIVTALQTAYPALEVLPFPDNPENYEFIHPTAALLVRYNGSSISPPDTVGFTTQTREYEFVVYSMTRNLRDHDGCYTILDGVRDCLLGLKLAGCEMIYQTSEELESEADGVWIFSQGFCIRTCQTQNTTNYNANNTFFNKL